MLPDPSWVINELHRAGGFKWEENIYLMILAALTAVSPLSSSCIVKVGVAGFKCQPKCRCVNLQFVKDMEIEGSNRLIHQMK